MANEASKLPRREGKDMRGDIAMTEHLLRGEAAKIMRSESKDRAMAKTKREELEEEFYG